MNTTSKQIWRTWNGNIEQDMSFVENVKAISFSDGLVFDLPEKTQYRKICDVWLWKHLGSVESSIIAYTLGETKACDKCVNGYALVGIDTVEPCKYCG